MHSNKSQELRWGITKAGEKGGVRGAVRGGIEASNANEEEEDDDDEEEEEEEDMQQVLVGVEWWNSMDMDVSATESKEETVVTEEEKEAVEATESAVS